MNKAIKACLPLLAMLFAWPSQAGTLLVANKSEASVSLFDTDAYTLRATLPTGEGPHEVAVSPDGRRALVTDYGNREQPGSSLTLVDVREAAVLGTIALPAGSRPHGVEWLDDRRAAVTAEGIRKLLLVDVETREVSAQLAVDQEVAHMVALGGGRAFVANIGSGTASVIDLLEGRKIADLESGEGTEGIALARGGQELWLTNRGADTVTVFDASALKRLAELPVPGFPIRAEPDEARGRVYVTLPRADALVAFEVAGRREVGRVAFDLGPDRERKSMFGDALPDSSVPVGVLLSGDGKSLFVAHSASHVIGVYDPDTLQRRALVPTGLEPDGMAWSPLSVVEPVKQP